MAQPDREEHMSGRLDAMGSLHGPVASDEPASHDTQRKGDTHPPRTEDQPAKPGDQDHAEPMGNIPPASAAELPASDPVSHAKELATRVMNRLKAEKKWFGLIDLERDQMMREAKAAIPDLVQRQIWVYSELDRMYPPVQPPNREIRTYGDNSDTVSESPHLSPYVPTKAPSLTDSDMGAIQGLNEIPDGWPALPANASLASELGWVQANRLFMVEERPGKATRVRLEQAASPAPSRAALGWLETSIRSYAKFVDVAAKACGGEDEGESAVMKRERKSVDEVRALLQEMKAAEGTCPHCGRPH